MAKRRRKRRKKSSADERRVTQVPERVDPGTAATDRLAREERPRRTRPTTAVRVKSLREVQAGELLDEVRYGSAPDAAARSMTRLGPEAVRILSEALVASADRLSDWVDDPSLPGGVLGEVYLRSDLRVVLACTRALGAIGSEAGYAALDVAGRLVRHMKESVGLALAVTASDLDDALVLASVLEVLYRLDEVLESTSWRLLQRFAG